MHRVLKNANSIVYIFTLILPLLLAITLFINKDISLLQALLVFLGPIIILSSITKVLFLLVRMLEKISEKAGTDIVFWGLIIIIIIIVLCVV